MSRPETKASSYGTEGEGPIHEGALSAEGRRFALVAARFNDAIVQPLIDGAREALRKSGAADGDIEIYRCPGAMELAGLARRVAETGRFDGVVCLGAVIRGGTPHFDLVAGESARGIGALAAEGKLAVAFGVLACDTLEQAQARSGGNEGNRGADAAMVAVEMADLYARMDRARAQALSVAPAPAPATTDLPRRK